MSASKFSSPQSKSRIPVFIPSLSTTPVTTPIAVRKTRGLAKTSQTPSTANYNMDAQTSLPVSGSKAPNLAKKTYVDSVSNKTPVKTMPSTSKSSPSASKIPVVNKDSKVGPAKKLFQQETPVVQLEIPSVDCESNIGLDHMYRDDQSEPESDSDGNMAFIVKNDLSMGKNLYIFNFLRLILCIF